MLRIGEGVLDLGRGSYCIEEGGEENPLFRFLLTETRAESNSTPNSSWRGKCSYRKRLVIPEEHRDGVGGCGDISFGGEKAEEFLFSGLLIIYWTRLLWDRMKSLI